VTPAARRQKSSRSRCRRAQRGSGTPSVSICSMRVSRMGDQRELGGHKKALARMSRPTATNSSSDSPCISDVRIASAGLEGLADRTFPGLL